MLGTLILWFGWYGFNAGSAVKIDSDLNPVVIAKSVVNTTLAAASSCIVALLLNLVIAERKTGEPVYNISSAMNGCLAGLAASAGNCGIIEPWAAIVIGLIAGLIYLGTSALLDKFCIDDAVNAIPVHFGGGAWGVLATGLFSSPKGLREFYGQDEFVGWFYSWGRGSGDFALMACQITGLISIILWTVVIMTPFFFILNYMGLFRSDALEEIVGLDISFHGYSPGGVPQNQIHEYYRKHKRYDLVMPEQDNEHDHDHEITDRFE
jgi:Amt family ammonium transporter